MAKKKIEQKIKGTFFPTKSIPDSFDDYKQLYTNLPIYAGLKGKKLEDEMRKDYAKLTGEKNETNKSDTDNGKAKK